MSATMTAAACECPDSKRRESGNLIALFREWRRRARGRRELAELGEQALHDIGLNRYDAYHEAKKPFWRA
jgi:uncharacterized protein YjiS (DUF1127 family)